MMTRLAERYARSIEYTARARAVTVGGAQTMSKMAQRFPEGAHPAFLVRGQGARVWDVDGNEYVDWMCALGAVPLGYRVAAIDDAVHSQIHDGALFTLPGPDEFLAAERICAKVRCAEQVRFLKSGSEACAAAVRIARRVTQRDRIVIMGYHGWHDWAQAAAPYHPGVPAVLETLVTRVPFNDIEGLYLALKGSPAPAAIMLEPSMLEEPKVGYLAQVVAMAHAVNALCIFDETITGLRWAVAGGMERYGVTPDLAVFGKGWANGYPLAFVCGPREYMKGADVISGTFGGDLLALVAMQAVLDLAEHQDVITPQWLGGAAMIEHTNRMVSKFGLDGFAEADGVAVHPRIRVGLDDATTEPYYTALFFQETARNGLLLHPAAFLVSAALTAEDLEQSKLAVTEALKVVAEAREGTPAQRKRLLEGKVLGPPPFSRPR